MQQPFPNLRRRLRDDLGPLPRPGDGVAPPSGLATRTLSRVADYCRSLRRRVTVSPAPRFHPSHPEYLPIPTLFRADVVAALLLACFVFGILVPAIVTARQFQHVVRVHQLPSAEINLHNPIAGPHPEAHPAEPHGYEFRPIHFPKASGHFHPIEEPAISQKTPNFLDSHLTPGLRPAQAPVRGFRGENEGGVDLITPAVLQR